MRKRFIDWLSGKPSKKKSRAKKILGNCVVASMWIYVFYSFSSGPGAVLASINPIGFTTIRCDNDIIHYTKDFSSSIDRYSSLIRESRRIVESVWNQGDAVVKKEKSTIHFYLTSNAGDVARLTMINGPGVTIGGNKIVVAVDAIEKLNWTMASVLKHEMSHVECGHRFGWIRGYFNFPVWLDEGIASNFSNFPDESENHLYELLKKNPQLNSLTALNSLSAWQSAFFSDHESVEKQYGFCRWVAKDLMSAYGMNPLQEYLGGKGDFRDLFGKTLKDYENDGAKTLEKSASTPGKITFVHPTASWKVAGLWTLQTGIVIAFFGYLLLWTIRQVWGLARAIAPLIINKPRCVV